MQASCTQRLDLDSTCLTGVVGLCAFSDGLFFVSAHWIFIIVSVSRHWRMSGGLGLLTVHQGLFIACVSIEFPVKFNAF